MRYVAHLEFDDPISRNFQLLFASDFEQLFAESDVLRVIVHFLEFLGRFHTAAFREVL